MFELALQVKDEHIDCQGIVDGLYYPFYLEECRHLFLHEITGLDLQQYADKGQHLVLAEYNLKFKSSLKSGDHLMVTCNLVPLDKPSRTKFAMYQEIICNNKVAAAATFIATCVPAAGGRPFIPDEIKPHLPADDFT